MTPSQMFNTFSIYCASVQGYLPPTQVEGVSNTKKNEPIITTECVWRYNYLVHIVPDGLHFRASKPNAPDAYTTH